MKRFLLVFLVSLAFLAGGASSHIPIGTARAAIKTDTVIERMKEEVAALGDWLAV